MLEKTIVVGLTHGDINGVGYEVITKVLLDDRMMEICTPLLYGSSKVASYHRKMMKNCGDFLFNIVRQPTQLSTSKPNLLNITETEIKVDIGKSTAIAGEMSFLALQKASEDLLNGRLDVLVTAPINKDNIKSANFPFEGHTEYIAQCCKSTNYLMMMVAGNMRIGTVTTHCALSQVSQLITKELVKEKIKIIYESLKIDFGCTMPRIAVLSLNPHASDNGRFGKEEADIICPAIEECFDEKIPVFGPYPADGLFGSGKYAKFDAILAMYHDQAMVPFKLLSQGKGVNFTAGLPIIRTSPAHGTAYDIAGKDIASEASMREAIYLACDIYRNRKEYNQKLD